MQVTFREASREDVPAIVDLLREDILGETREGRDLIPYLAAFDAMQAEPNNTTIVGVCDAQIVATYQLTFISGISLAAARRAQVESVRVARDLKGKGIGRAMFADAEKRARAAGCGLIQLTMNTKRTESRLFYEAIGFTASHVGFKRDLK